MQWLVLFVLLTLVHWIAIYPLHSVTQPLNNWGLGNKEKCLSEILSKKVAKMNSFCLLYWS